MKNKKGFTLIELLGVITILGIIMVIATSAVGKVIENSKIKARYIAAEEITNIAMAYMETEGGESVSVQDLKDDGYLEDDVTNPSASDPQLSFSNQIITKDDTVLKQDGYELQGNCYKFDGYKYCFN